MESIDDETPVAPANGSNVETSAKNEVTDAEVETIVKKTVRFASVVSSDCENVDTRTDALGDAKSGVESTAGVEENEEAIGAGAERPVPSPNGESVPGGDDGGLMADAALTAASSARYPASYERVFTDSELNAIEEGRWEITEPEPEEYDKEIEDRLFPLNEVDLKTRMETNAKRLKEPSLETLSEALGIPIETLRRTKEASVGELNTQEYWNQWYQDTLATAGEAKRANRDFRGALNTEDRAEINSVIMASDSRNGEGEVMALCSERKDGDMPCDECLETSLESGRPYPDPPSSLPRRWCGVARQAVYELICDEFNVPPQYESEPQGLRAVEDPNWAPCFDEVRAADHLGRLSGSIPDRLWDSMMKYMETVFVENGALISAKIVTRRGLKGFGLPKSFPDMNCSVLFDEPASACKRKPGLREWQPDERTKRMRDYSNGKRFLCSIQGIEGIEATSWGHLDCLPAEMLVDTGAIGSLLNSKVLRRLGLLDAPLRPYHKGLTSASGHGIKILGEIDLPLRLGSVEIVVPFVVTEDLHVDAILGTDILTAFRAVIDMEERHMTLKSSGEVFKLGVEQVIDAHTVRATRNTLLPPGHQLLLATQVDGEVETGAVVLVESSLEANAKLRVARSVCTVHENQVVVELCNATTKEILIERGSVVANTTVLPKAAFAWEREPSVPRPEPTPRDEAADFVSSVIGRVTTDTDTLARMPGLKEDRMLDNNDDLEVDFSSSKLTEEQRDILRKELNAFRDLFVETSKKPGRTDLLKFSIDTGTHQPIKQRPYSVSQAEGEVMEAEIQQYLELGIIRPSTSPWASPVLMIRKPDGGIRFCIDYRRLNAVTIKDSYPMPLIDDILDVLGNAKLFSTMDIASGYWNVPMDPGSVEKTAFTCKYGLYEWLVMPFGLCNAVPAFERLMETVLVDLKWRTCLVYLDDCVVFSTDFPTHLVRLRQVLERFRSAGFKLKMKKCHWGRSQVAFLGHIVTPTGILPNPEKVKAVMNAERPCDLHTLRAFLGLTSYFRRYIPGYAGISAPLERLKQKDAAFEWNEDCEDAFLKLRRVLVKPPILIYPDFSKRFKLFVDSSRIAVGACLMQEVEGHDRVVAYASKLLVGSERNWVHHTDGITEIECWGIVWATRKFHCYLDRKEFDLFTDHKALTWVFSPENRTSNAKLARWAMELSQLRFKVYHKAGTLMGHADGLSRMLRKGAYALTMQDLLNDDIPASYDGPSLVGEPPAAPDNGTLPVEPARYSARLVGEPPAAPIASEVTKEVATLAADVDARLVGEPPASPPPAERTRFEGDAARQTDEGEDSDQDVPASNLDLYGLDRDKFCEEQSATPWIQAVIAFLGDGTLVLDPQMRVKVLRLAPHFKVMNGLLYRKVYLQATGGHADTITVPVIPLTFVETVLHYLHKDVLAGHPSCNYMTYRVRRHAYWLGWEKDVAEYVRTCGECSAAKGPRPWRNGLMQPMPVQELKGPFSLLVVDAVGPLKTTERGNKYILVFVDYFTRWAEAFAVSSLDTMTFVDCMINGVVSRHGIPERLLSDRGTNFVSALAKSFYETLGIKKSSGAAYHPQTQGLVERFNRTLISTLRMYVDELQSDWDVYLQRVLFAYRTSFHEALGDSPFAASMDVKLRYQSTLRS